MRTDAYAALCEIEEIIRNFDARCAVGLLASLIDRLGDGMHYTPKELLKDIQEVLEDDSDILHGKIN
jgi:hypothetical protein